MPAAEHIERQVAVVVVITVEETSFLMPVQRVVGSVEVEDDLRRRRGMRVEKDIDEHGLDQRRVIADFVIARGLCPAQLQPVECRLAGQSDRLASSLPPSTAITGSWRNWSWSIRSS